MCFASLFFDSRCCSLAECLAMQKILIIRFSSLGDIAQAMNVVSPLRNEWPSSEIHWLTRDDFSSIVKLHPAIDQVWGYRKKDGMKGLFQLLKELKKQNFTHVYDAHSNLRSFICRLFFLFSNAHWLRRPKNRLKRILLFTFRINTFPKPFRGAESFIDPLKKWSSNIQLSDAPLETQFLTQDLPFSDFPITKAFALAPSAAWAMKRWPIEYWSELIRKNPESYFIILGGPEDTFCDELKSLNPNKVLNLAGKLSWVQTAKLISLVRGTISGDTGALHLADLFGRPAIAILGPTAFGYPSHPNSKVLVTDLSCQPCTKDGRGHCRNAVYQKCLKDITPEMVQKNMDSLA